MSASPLTKNISKASVTITAGGQKLEGAYFLKSISIDTCINKIATAEIVLYLKRDEKKKQTFEQSEETHLVPGKDVEIQLGYEQKNKPVFKGIITNLGLKTYSNRYYLFLKCCDKAVKLTLSQKTKYFKKKKDSELFATILSEGGLDKAIDDTKIKHPMMMQCCITDWDFIKQRAMANGLLVYTADNKVYIKKPGIKANTALKLSHGKDVFSFHGELDGRFQLPNTSCSAWSMTNQKMLSGKSSEPAMNKQGNLNGKKVANDIGFAQSDFFSSTPMEEGELTAWANAVMTNSRLTYLKGSITFIGNASPKLNEQIELSGFGKRFDGKALITRIKQNLEEGNWKTIVEFGLRPNFFETLNKGNHAGASGLLPAVSGLQIGKVKKIDDDPLKENRIQITLPLMNDEAEGIWARLANFFSTSDKGAFFIPDVDDEVVVGFLNGDPRHAVILGMLYSSKIKAPYKIKADNFKKGIVTKEDLKLEFDDEKKAVTIETPGGNKVIFSDDDKSIKIEDQNGNEVNLTSSGIELKSGKKIVLKGSQGVEISGQKIDLKADMGIKLKGMKIDAKADSSLGLESSGMGSLKAGGILTVKGSMVKIN